MRSGRLAAPALLAGLLLAPAVAPAQTTFPLDIEVGYRTLDLSGSRDMYRSQVNERSGLFLRTLSFSAVDLGSRVSFLDTLRLEVADLGASPHGSLRLTTGRSDLWRLRLDWRRAEVFSALPGWALGQHTADRTRNTLDAELELLPGRAITPFVGYSLHRTSGPGTTTYSVGGDEFLLRSDLRSKEQEVRVGASFAAGPVSGSVTQGWRKLEEVEALALAPGAGNGNGNSGGTVLGIPVSLTSFARTSSFDVNTPVTNAFVTGRFGILKVTGSYVRANSSGDGPEREELAGNLVSFAILRSFRGLTSDITARARLEQWRAGGRAELQLAKGLDVHAGYSSRHRELDGLDLVSELYTGTASFSGTPGADLAELLTARTAMERDERVFDVGAAWRDVGPFSFHAAWKQTDQDLTITPDPSQIVVPGGQGGTFDRRIRGFLGGARFAHGGFSLGLEVETGQADLAVVRTDFTSRDRVRLRAEWKPIPAFRVGGTYVTVKSTQRNPGSGYRADAQQYSVDAEGTPLPWLTLHLSAARLENDTTIPIRIPQTFAIATSVYGERGDYLEGGVRLAAGPLLLDASLAHLESDGTSPFKIDRARLRAEMTFPGLAGFGAGFELASDSYEERTRGLGDYSANRYGVFLRFRQ